jgi:hypothetical protein
MDLIGIIKTIAKFILGVLPKRLSKWVIRNYRPSNKYRPSRYDTKSLSFREIKKKLTQCGVTIRTPYPAGVKWVKIAEENRKGVGSADLKTHRFGDYYFQLASFLNSEKSATIGKGLRCKYWENYDPLNKKDKLRDLGFSVGWHDNIKPGGRIISEEQCGEKLYKINFCGRFGLNYCVFHGKPKGVEVPEGIVIALHGSSSGPDYVMGLDGKEDYTRRYGAYWVEKGYEVYAPQVNWSSSTAFDLVNCNYSHLGDDLAKIDDLVRFIVEARKGSGGKAVPIVVAGISYSGKLAALAGIFLENIDSIITIASVGADWFDIHARNSQWANIKAKKYVVDPIKPGWTSRFNGYMIYFDELGLYKLLAPKPLIISGGLHDLPEAKFKTIFQIVDYYESIGHGNDIKLNIFDGMHESDPCGEFSAYKKLKSLL